jgi:D-lactate dehydrogenase
VIITAHQAFFTREALIEIATTTLANMKAWLDGAPRNLVDAPSN